MKKGLKILVIMVTAFMSESYVKADTILNIQYGGSNYSEYYYLNNLEYNYVNVYKKGVEGLERISCNSREDCYNKAITYYENSEYQYYTIMTRIYPTNNNIEFDLKLFNFSDNDTYYQQVYNSGNNYVFLYSDSQDIGAGFKYLEVVIPYSDPNRNSFYRVYDYNFNFNPDGNYAFSGFYDNEDDNINNMIKINTGKSIPKIKDLIQYSSWSDYESNHLEGYKEINLDNYNYVILTLKNYDQTNAFTTNLQVKGQIGITPIYNYGQTSKDSITGVKVQDRCNVAYQNYTTYPIYILQQDLQNNAVYVVKECSNNSSFKYDENVFNITYVTQENEDKPQVVINGKTYDVIPYDDLPSTATKNEEENYIPGESGSANDTGGLDSAIKNAQNKLSEIWNTITYFTDFIGQIFSSLPNEVRAILISGFTIMIVLGVIKIFLGK